MKNGVRTSGRSGLPGWKNSRDKKCFSGPILLYSPNTTHPDARTFPSDTCPKEEHHTVQQICIEFVLIQDSNNRGIHRIGCTTHTNESTKMFLLGFWLAWGYSTTPKKTKSSENTHSCNTVGTKAWEITHSSKVVTSVLGTWYVLYAMKNRPVVRWYFSTNTRKKYIIIIHLDIFAYCSIPPPPRSMCYR